ncbi:Cys-Gly metallodipeptidase dug1 [Neochlamydia sp. AcF65]|nr:Cys-Gly metallodipeptidase dug1 [Neochlamydia sp. AcF65]
MQNSFPSLHVLQDYYKKQEKIALEEYFAFLRFQSISSEIGYTSQMEACAQWVMSYLKNIGFEAEIWPTKGHPVIFASYMKAGPSQPTLLIYNHYDVQPIDPLEAWHTSPFEPTIRHGEVYARGAQDNKGQCFYTLFAIKALMNIDGKLPINVKFCIEGEEECGSLGLSGLLAYKKKELQADYLAIVDLGLRHPTAPAVTLGVRGIVTMDVEVKGAKTDLHSGSYGGIAYNPLHALVDILAQLRDPAGRIRIPDFYKDVQELSPEEKERITFDFDEQDYFFTFGAKPTGGEKNYTPLERSWLRPTIEINGISGGYAGEGFKTVIPSQAIAKLSCRLVPHQSPEETAKKIANFIEQKAPEGVEVKVHIHAGGGKAVRIEPSSKCVQAFAKAYEEVYKTSCAFTYSGGSIPIIQQLSEASQSEVVLMGLGLPDDQIHAPNEHFGIDRLEKGYLIIARTLEFLAN